MRPCPDSNRLVAFKGRLVTGGLVQHGVLVDALFCADVAVRSRPTEVGFSLCLLPRGAAGCLLLSLWEEQ